MICSECGARITEGAERCDLCGYPVEPEAGDMEAAGMDCPACARPNPAGARFCNQCGGPLLPAEKEPSSSSARSPEVKPAAPESFLARSGTMILGIGLAIVVILYFITYTSKMYQRPDTGVELPSTEVQAPLAPPLPGEIAERAGELNREIESAASPAARLEKQEELLELYRTALRPDLAAEVQVQIAESEGTAESWAAAGNYFYDLMVQQEDRSAAAYYARKAVDVYRRSLEIDPSNLDVRTELAVSYLYDAQNPMAGVEEITKVLAEAPDHVHANFNYGIMLAQIGRMEQAAEQFQKVIDLTPADSPAHQRAVHALQTMQHP